MSTDPTAAASEESSTGQPVGAGGAQGQPSEDELRAAYEAEMSRITSADMVLQAVVSLLNIGGYRLGLAPGGDQPVAGARDLEQVRDAIDGVRALLPILERSQPAESRPLRDALSQLQMAYAREVGASAPAEKSAPADQSGAQAPAAPEQNAPAASEQRDGPGPAQSSGRLWVPGR